MCHYDTDYDSYYDKEVKQSGEGDTMRKLSKKQIKLLDDECVQFYTEFVELPVRTQERSAS